MGKKNECEEFLETLKEYNQKLAEWKKVLIKIWKLSGKMAGDNKRYELMTKDGEKWKIRNPEPWLELNGEDSPRTQELIDENFPPVTFFGVEVTKDEETEEEDFGPILKEIKQEDIKIFRKIQ